MGRYGSILLLVAMIAVMYFLLIRPQRKREKETNAMRSSIRVGDEIITIGGICGKVVKTKEETLVIQVGADKVKFEVMRWSISKIVKKGEEAPVRKVEEEPEEPQKTTPKRMKPIAEETAEEAEDVAEEVTETAEEESAEDGNKE